MEKFITKAQVSYQAIKDHSPKVPIDKGLQAAGSVASVVGGAYTYKSHKLKSISSKIEMCSYAEKLRQDVAARKISKVRAQLLLKEIGFSPDYLNPTKEEIATLKSTEQLPTKFACISRHYFNPMESSKHTSTVAVPAEPPSHRSYIAKDNPYKVGLASLAGLGLYLLMTAFLHSLGTFMRTKSSEK